MKKKIRSGSKPLHQSACHFAKNRAHISNTNEKFQTSTKKE